MRCKDAINATFHGQSPHWLGLRATHEIATNAAKVNSCQEAHAAAETLFVGWEPQAAFEVHLKAGTMRTHGLASVTGGHGAFRA